MSKNQLKPFATEDEILQSADEEIIWDEVFEYL